MDESWPPKFFRLHFQTKNTEKKANKIEKLKSNDMARGLLNQIASNSWELSIFNIHDKVGWLCTWTQPDVPSHGATCESKLCNLGK